MKPSSIIIKHLLQHDSELLPAVVVALDPVEVDNFFAGCVAFKQAKKPVPYHALPNLFGASMSKERDSATSAGASLCYLLKAMSAAGLFAVVDKTARTVVVNTEYPGLFAEDYQTRLDGDEEAVTACNRLVELAMREDPSIPLTDIAADECYALLTYKSPSSHVHSA